MADTPPIGIARMQQRGDTAANWQSFNPVLAAFEIGFISAATDPRTITGMKVGDGVTAWNDLQLFSTGGGPGGGPITEDQLPPETIALLAQLSSSVDDLNAAVAQLQQDASGDRLPVGSTMFYAGVSPPSGWLVEDGSLVSRTLYPSLWEHAQASGMLVADAEWSTGTAHRSKFSTGDGSTTFRIPDLITDGLFVRALSGGATDFGRRQEDEFKSHTHVQDGRTTLSLNGGISNGNNNSNGGTGGTTGASGGLETRPKNTGRLPIIKAFTNTLNPSFIDVGELATMVAGKVDVSTFTSTQLLAVNGFKIRPGQPGLIEQWGSFTGAYAAAVPITFPIAFPTTCLSVHVVTDTAGATFQTATAAQGVTDVTLVGFKGWGGGMPYNRWFAIGY